MTPRLPQGVPPRSRRASDLTLLNPRGRQRTLSSAPRHSATERSYNKGRPTRDANETPGSLVVRAATLRFVTTPVRMKPLPPGVTSTGTERQSRDLVGSWRHLTVKL